MHTAWMASANVEIVRSIFAAWGQGDLNSSGWADPEIEFAFAGGPDPTTGTGVPAMAESFRRPCPARGARVRDGDRCAGGRALLTSSCAGEPAGAGFELATSATPPTQLEWTVLKPSRGAWGRARRARRVAHVLSLRTCGHSVRLRTLRGGRHRSTGSRAPK
jgi:hypothetical protein